MSNHTSFFNNDDDIVVVLGKRFSTDLMDDVESMITIAMKTVSVLYQLNHNGLFTSSSRNFTLIILWVMLPSWRKLTN